MCIPNEILFQSFKCALRDRIARLVFYSCCCFLSVLCWFCCCWCCCCCCCYCWLPPNRLDSSLVVEHKPFAYSVLFVRRLESIDVCWLRFIFFYIIYFFLASHCRLHCVRSLYIGSYKKRSKSTIMYLDHVFTSAQSLYFYTISWNRIETLIYEDLLRYRQYFCMHFFECFRSLLLSNERFLIKFKCIAQTNDWLALYHVRLLFQYKIYCFIVFRRNNLSWSWITGYSASENFILIPKTYIFSSIFQFFFPINWIDIKWKFPGMTSAK